MTGKKKPKRIKHIPQRTCVGCQQVAAKKELLRLVWNENGMIIDPTGKLAGRGVYLHKNRACWEKGLKGAISRGLRTELSDEDVNKLKLYLEELS